MAAILDENGYASEQVASGSEALEHLRENVPDAIVIAWELPDVSAPEFLEHLQRDDDLRWLPALVLTSHDDPVRIRDALDSGAVDYLRKPITPIELHARLRAALRVRDLQDELRRLASIDPLTGMLNRRAFLEHFEREVDRTGRYGNELGLAILDIDHFKNVNDTHGHDVGDEVICSLAKLFGESLRDSDLAARWGGEEFVVLLIETPGSDASSTLNRLRAKLETMQVSQHQPELRVTCSGGYVDLAGVPRGVATEDLLKAADEALYFAKESGRNRIIGADLSRSDILPHTDPQQSDSST